MIVSIQGIKGAFHEEAARQYFSENIDILEQITFKEVISSVKQGAAHYGVMAIENTISGTIGSNLELIKQSGLTIVGEIDLKIEQHLVVNKGIKIDEITEVESHYMAINQCRPFFDNYPDIRLKESEDTALSMRNIVQNRLRHVGAIGSQLGAQFYGLDIIERNIQSHCQNYTRFLILEYSPVEPSGYNKSTIHLTVSKNKCGLTEVLSHFTERCMTLCKIESLPIQGYPWQYQYYLDLNFQDTTSFEDAINSLNKDIQSLTVLGKYKQHTTQ